MTSDALRTSLLSALKNIDNIDRQLARAPGLIMNIFATPGDLSDNNVDNVRKVIGFESLALVQNLHNVKTNNPTLQSFPDIHYKLDDQISRRNWLAHEYRDGTTARIGWNEVAISIYEGVPKIKAAIVAALKSMGAPIP